MPTIKTIIEGIGANTAPQTEPCPLCDRLDSHPHSAAEWRAAERKETTT